MSNPTPTFASPAAPHQATVEQLCAYLRDEAGGEDPALLLCEFARIFFSRAPVALLAERSAPQLAAMIRGAFGFLDRSLPEQVSVELASPEDEGWDAPVTIIRAEVGDRPFIVDTIREYLGAEGISILGYIYPVYRVVRGPDGRIAALADGSTGEEGEGTLEALDYIEIPRIHEPARREEIRAEIARRLADVVAATGDFPRMQEELARTAATVEGYAAPAPERAAEYQEIAEFLRWLGRGNFVFLGFRGYEIGGTVAVEPGSGLGILSDPARSGFAQPVPLASLPDDVRDRAVHGPLLIVSKANAQSTVHRLARMDYVGVKRLDEAGRVTGERRFLGLFTSQAYNAGALEVPIVRRKAERILAASGARPDSHDYKEIVTILNAMPKEELFESSVEQLEDAVQTVLASIFSQGVHVRVRRDRVRDEAAVMTILPARRYSAEVERRIRDLLTARLGGTPRETHLARSSRDQVRLHVYVCNPTAAEGPEEAALEGEIAELIRSWEDRLVQHLAEGEGAGEAARLGELYGGAFPAEYRAAVSPAAAVHDVLHLEVMQRLGHSVSLRLRAPLEGERVPAGATVLSLYLRGETLVLSDFMPILEDAGVRVLEVDTFTLRGAGLAGELMIYSFAVQTREGGPIPPERAEMLGEALLASHRGDAPRDPYNGLTLRVGLRWREVDVLRTYANYAAQVGAVPSWRAPERALSAYPRVARLLVDLFAARHDPARAASTGPAEAESLRAELSRELEQVKSLTDDRALRRMLQLVEATVRTNYFRGGGADPVLRSGGVPYVAIKVRSADVEELKKTRLLFEVYVHSSRMEGVHLRGASVSRGGIRWSDRPDDFRTEILGLVTTQVVKNATIVPSGSKGGFITKKLLPDRDQQMAEAAEQYKTLMRGLLDMTDNLVDGRVVPPEGVVRHDGDDPYLVVAADKGTAHLSDTANAVAAEYGFWLGDAFASGGSHGYDHKEEGITARGGWECVKRHFRELGKDIQKEPFTVAGIGDMSGDVFGNGMLLSEQIRLVAAFDHRHVFLDPDPDPAVSFAERKRMFALPRSSWEDYDRALLSPGGMIVPRASKEVVLTPEVRRALGLAEETERLDGEGLIRAVLSAPVELLWNGGIGTYVKDPQETHADVGDTTNDPVRVDADELRCKVVGEGGNLGFTQRARIAFALAGGKVNTDALDNSAGVDMSDHEVNLKILLNRVVADGEMSPEGRNELLEAMTDRVSELVLRNNIGQSLAVSLDERRSREALHDFNALIGRLEADRRLDRAREEIPDPDTIADRAWSGRGLTRPTLAVLLSHAKLYAKQQLLASDLPDDPATDEYLVGYFPAEATRAAGPERLRQHRLRREIVTTELVNDLVNLMGASFLHRVSRDTGAEIPAVVRAWLIASRIAGAAEIRADMERLEGQYPADTIYRWLLGLSRVLERTTAWLLGNLAADAPAAATIEEARAGLATLRGEFARFVSGEDRAVFLERLGELQNLRVERTLGERLITLRFLPQLMEIVALSREGAAGGGGGAAPDPIGTARAFYAVSDRFSTARLREDARRSAREDAWERRFAELLADEVSAAQRAIARTVLARAGGGGDVEGALVAFEAEREREVRVYREMLAEVKASTQPSLAACALAVRSLQAVAAGAR